MGIFNKSKNKGKSEIEVIKENTMKVASAMSAFSESSEALGFDVLNKAEDALQAIILAHEVFIQTVEQALDIKLSREGKIHLMTDALGEFLKPFGNEYLNDDKLKKLMTDIFDKKLKMQM